MKPTEVVVYVAGLLLSLASFVLTSLTKFGGLVPDSAQAEVGALALSVFLFLIADRIANSVRDNIHFRQLSSDFKTAVSAIPNYDTIFEFTSCDEAMVYLSKRLPGARVVLNTKVSPDAIPPRREVASRYAEAMHEGFVNGMVYRELVSTVFAEDARHLAKEHEGQYSFQAIQPGSSCFLNFIVLDYEGEPDEVVVGWATSRYAGMEQKAYRIRDKRIVKYFQEYHTALWPREHASPAP